MKFRSLYLIVFLIFLVSSCAKEKEKISIVEEESLESQMIKTYNEGLNEFDRGDVIFAAKNLMKQSYYIHNLYGLQEQL